MGGLADGENGQFGAKKAQCFERNCAKKVSEIGRLQKMECPKNAFTQPFPVIPMKIPEIYEEGGSPRFTSQDPDYQCSWDPGWNGRGDPDSVLHDAPHKRSAQPFGQSGMGNPDFFCESGS